MIYVDHAPPSYVGMLRWNPAGDESTPDLHVAYAEPLLTSTPLWRRTTDASTEPPTVTYAKLNRAVERGSRS